MRGLGIGLIVVLVVGLFVIGAPKPASAALCFAWDVGGTVCINFLQRHQQDFAGAFNALGFAAAHFGGGFCSLNSVGSTHTVQGTYTVNSVSGLNIGFSDQAAGPGCIPSFNQFRIPSGSLTGNAFGYSLNLVNGIVDPSTLTGSFIAGSIEEIERAAALNAPPDDGTPRK